MTDQLTPMTLDEIDEALPALRKKWEVSLSNVLALSSMVTYQRLTGEGGWPKVALAGKTQVEVAGALEAFNELFLNGDTLRQKLEEAEKLRKDMPRLNRADQIDKITFILKGACIKLPAVQVPLEQRGLLTAAEIEQAVTIDRLFAAMETAFTEANRVVHAIEDAWGTLKGKLRGAVDEVALLEQLATNLAESNCVQLIAAKSKLAAVLGLVDSDPLSVKHGFDQEIEPLIKPARELLNSLSAQRDQVNVDMKGTRPLVDALKDAHAQGKKLYAERAEKVTVAGADKLPAPAEDAGVDRLSKWLDRLEQKLSLGDWRAVRVGLENWSIQLNSSLSHARSVATENNKLLEKRRELRGLLDSLKAMAASRGLAEDPAASAIYTKAHDLLYTRPTPLAEAEKLVVDYQKAIR